MAEFKSIFETFESISDQDWRDKVIADLKGKDYRETLVWTDECGIDHQPYYRASDLEKIPLLEEIQAAQKKQAGWHILQEFSLHEKGIKKKIDHALENGVDQVIISEVNELDSVLDYLGKKYKGKAQVKALLDYLPTEHLLKQFFLDPVGERLKSGKQLDHEAERMKKLFQERLNQLEPDPFLLVDGTIYKNAGATIVQEIALCLQHATEYLHQFTETGFTAAAIARSLEIKTGYGPSFFAEIAKGRALRYLMSKLFDAYGLDAEASFWAEPSLHYLSHKDSYNNLLRATSMCMAAVLGNNNHISVPAFNQLEKPSSLGVRMAKNIQLILKEESYFAQVRDIAGGSYYIESLTAQIAEAAWNQFLEYEKAGGLINMFENGSLQKELNQSFNNRKDAYNNGRTLLGVNKYPNPEGDELKVQLKKVNGISPKVIAKEIAS